MIKDYYTILGVGRKAGQKTIRDAYRNLIKKYHPDLSNADDTVRRFIEAKEAYETLSDVKKKKKYDEELVGGNRRAGTAAGGGAGESVRERASPGRPDGPAYAEAAAFAEVFPEEYSGERYEESPSGFFAGSAGPRSDLYFQVVLSDAESRYGCAAPVSIAVPVPCPRCYRYGFWEKFFCPVCSGDGWVRTVRSFRLAIPPGVKNGTRTRISLGKLGLRDRFLDLTIYVDPHLPDEV
jgi:molecular chaperone DnaJ